MTTEWPNQANGGLGRSKVSLRVTKSIEAAREEQQRSRAMFGSTR